MTQINRQESLKVFSSQTLRALLLAPHKNPENPIKFIY